MTDGPSGKARNALRVCAAALVLSAAVMPSACTGGQRRPPPARRATFGDLFGLLQEKLAETVTVAGAGDVNLGDGVTPYLSSNGVDYPWADASAIFAPADLAFVNLECCISSGGAPVPGKEFCFRGPPDCAAGIRRAGVDVVSLANNHSKDYGTGSLVETFDHLKKNGVAWCGAGMNDEEAYAPRILSAGPLKVAFVAFTCIVPEGWPATRTSAGCATAWDERKVAGTVKRAKADSDFVVASFHWGVELAVSPSGEQVELAHLAVDSGADLVLGHHPHVVQGFELYNNRLIAYSLGNFVFSPPREISSKTVAVVALLGPRGLIQARVVPMAISGCRPTVMEGARADSWLAAVAGHSRGLGTELRVSGGRGFIDGGPPGGQPAVRRPHLK